VAFALALVATATSSSALADARTEARRHFRAGMELISKGKYDDGVTELEKAQELLPHPNVVFNIARAHAEAGHLEQAIAAYRTYIDSEPPDREVAMQVVKQLEEKLALQRAEQTKAPEPTGGAQTGGAQAGDTKTGDTKTRDTQTSDTNTGDTKTGDTKTGDGSTADKKRDQAEVNKIVGAAREEDVYRETVITASRGAQSPLDSPNSTTIITRQDIRLSGITRIPELLRRVPGMDVMQVTGGDSNVSIRGFNSRLANKLLVLINGRPAYNDILGATFWETLSIDVDQIERIEIVRGPGSALYGANAFAGIVNIIMIAPGEGRTGFRLGVGDGGQGYGSAWASGRDGDFAYRASVGYTHYTRWTREVQDGRKDIVLGTADHNLGTENLRVDIRLAQRFKQNRELQVGGGFARSQADIYGIGPFNDFGAKFDSSDVTVLFKSDHFSARAYYARFVAELEATHDYRGHTLYPGKATQNSLDGELQFYTDFKAPRSVEHSIRAGAAYRLKVVDWNYLAKDAPIENHGSIFLQDTLRLGRAVQIVVSGRADYVPYLQNVVLSPRGSLIIKPTDRQSIRVSGSSAFRNPTFLESYLDLPIQAQMPGVELVSASKRQEDPNFRLQPERIITAEASYLNQMSDLFEFELTAYYNRISNLIVLAPARPRTLANRADGIGGFNPATGRYTVGFGGWENRCDTYNVFGGEVGTRVYPIEGLDLFANYALNLSSQELPAGCNLPEDRRTSRHKINAGVQLRTKPGIDGEITVNYQTAQTWTEQVATSQGVEYQQFDLPGYLLLNGRLGWRFPLVSTTGEVSIAVFNALAGLMSEEPQMHPFGNRVGRRVMAFFSHTL
jgi:iron complex outermembrane receptor protein